MGTARVRVTEVVAGAVADHEDSLAVEEPLEIRLEGPDGPQPLAVTMRAPGHDLELVAGFLLSEGVVREPSDVRTLRHCVQVPRDRRESTVTAQLPVAASLRATARRLTISSACGVCATESLELLAERAAVPVRRTAVDPDLVLALPDLLRQGQTTVERTGGLVLYGGELAPT